MISPSQDPAVDLGSNAAQQGQLDDLAGDAPPGGDTHDLPTALLARVPPDATEEEWSYLTFGYADFKATVGRDPTVPEFDAALARWEAGPGPGALGEVSTWIDAIAVLESAFPERDGEILPMPATQIATLRDEIAKLPTALQVPYHLKCQAAAAYDNERDNVLNYTEDVNTKVWNGDTKGFDTVPHSEGENHEDKRDGGTCNLSSTAMALRGMGVDTSSEALFEDVDKNAELYPQMGDAVEEATDGAYVLWQLNAEAKPEFWTGVVDGLLGRGYGTMLHVPGHVVRLEAVEEGGLRVDDPYGSEKFVGGDRRVVEGNSVENPDAGEDTLWPFTAPDDVQFIGPDPLPEDVAGQATRKGNTVTATDGLLAGRRVTKR